MEKKIKLNKTILSEYIDACELVKETEEDIRRLEKHETVHDKVYGSNPEFPYQKMSFPVSGAKVTRLDGEKLEKEKQLLQQRKEKAREIKIRAEEVMNSAPVRIQRIIRYKFFEGLSWEAVAHRMGRKATADSVRMEFNNFFKEK